jgi:hypothetical protein
MGTNAAESKKVNVLLRHLIYNGTKGKITQQLFRALQGIHVECRSEDVIPVIPPEQGRVAIIARAGFISHKRKVRYTRLST